MWSFLAVTFASDVFEMLGSLVFCTSSKHFSSVSWSASAIYGKNLSTRTPGEMPHKRKKFDRRFKKETSFEIFLKNTSGTRLNGDTAIFRTFFFERLVEKSTGFETFLAELASVKLLAQLILF